MRWYSFILLSYFAFLCFSPSIGQSITIKSVSLQPSDKTAIEQFCLDNNGDTCALLKIKTDHLENIQFSNPNQYIKYTYSDGVYSVYVPSISRKIDIQHRDYMPIQLDLANYGFRTLKKGKTYLVVLDAPRKNELKSSVVLKVEPKNANVVLDETKYEINSNGMIEIPIGEGRHTYYVSADNYQSNYGSISVGKSEVKTISVRLLPIMQEMLVGCNIDNARVFVDNVEYGGIGKMQIPHGLHKIRVQADGYVDLEKDVNVNSSTKWLSFTLKENKTVTHVHATPVKIVSESSSIYKNNKKIKEWTSGATIMFMPGKYLLSDDKGHSLKILVGDEPMVITL